MKLSEFFKTFEHDRRVQFQFTLNKKKTWIIMLLEDFCLITILCLHIWCMCVYEDHVERVRKSAFVAQNIARNYVHKNSGERKEDIHTQKGDKGGKQEYPS